MIVPVAQATVSASVELKTKSCDQLWFPIFNKEPVIVSEAIFPPVIVLLAICDAVIVRLAMFPAVMVKLSICPPIIPAVPDI